MRLLSVPLQRLYILVGIAPSDGNDTEMDEPKLFSACEKEMWCPYDEKSFDLGKSENGVKVKYDEEYEVRGEKLFDSSREGKTRERCAHSTTKELHKREKPKV